jgi:hypothetical protein
MPKADRHKGKKMQFYLSDDDIARLDRLTSGCKTVKERFLRLMEKAENKTGTTPYQTIARWLRKKKEKEQVAPNGERPS